MSASQPDAFNLAYKIAPFKGPKNKKVTGF
jgi:hypothetical protein